MVCGHQAVDYLDIDTPVVYLVFFLLSYYRIWFSSFVCYFQLFLSSLFHFLCLSN